MSNKHKRALAFVIPMMMVYGAAQAAITTTVLSNDSRQCVDYARSVVSSLPYGLYTLADKRRIINGYSCSAGSVAIINVGNTVGHVAVVNSCSPSTIKITETNWVSGKKTTRTAFGANPASQLRIVGYFR